MAKCEIKIDTNKINWDKKINNCSKSNIWIQLETSHPSLADLEGACPAHAPLRVQILSF